MASLFKKCRSKIRILSTNNDMLIMIEKGIRGATCHVILRYAKANNKFIKNYNKNIEL